MADRFIPVSQGVTCEGCKQPITGQFVKVGNSSFHPDHFCCNKCNKSLAGVPYLNKDGKNWCKECHSEAYGMNCSICKKGISGSYVKVDGKNVHKECFVCTDCKQAFPGGQYYTHEEKPYCGKCYAHVKGLICGRCHKEIEQEYMVALDKKWHLTCFTCKKCNKPVGGSFIPDEGQPIHPTCFSITCCVCSKSIDGQICEAEGNAMHSECFVNYKTMRKEGKIQASDDFSAPAHEEKKEEHVKPAPAPAPTQSPPKPTPAPAPTQSPPKPTPPAPAPVQPAPSPKKEEEAKAPAPAPAPVPPPAPAKKEADHKAIDELKPNMIEKPPAAPVAVQSSSKEAPPTPSKFYTLKDLSRAPYPPDVDTARRESYLSDEEFKKTLTMDKAKFYALPYWKQHQLKSKFKLA